jgi:hypothetical protein
VPDDAITEGDLQRAREEEPVPERCAAQTGGSTEELGESEIEQEEAPRIARFWSWPVVVEKSQSDLTTTLLGDHLFFLVPSSPTGRGALYAAALLSLFALFT